MTHPPELLGDNDVHLYRAIDFGPAQNAVTALLDKITQLTAERDQLRATLDEYRGDAVAEILGLTAERDGFKDDSLRLHKDKIDYLERAITAEAERDAALTQVVDRTDEKNGAYLERNQLVALLARIFPSGLKRTAIDGWSDDWHGCVYIDLPTGQASWHYHDSHAYLFAGLPPYQGEWDGHTTPEKYERVAAANPLPKHLPHCYGDHRLHCNCPDFRNNRDAGKIRAAKPRDFGEITLTAEQATKPQEPHLTDKEREIIALARNHYLKATSDLSAPNDITPVPEDKKL